MGILLFSLLLFILIWGCLSNYTPLNSHCGTKLIISLFKSIHLSFVLLPTWAFSKAGRKSPISLLSQPEPKRLVTTERSRISLHPFRLENDTTSQARNLRLPDLNLENLQLIITLKLVLHAR